MKQLNYRIYKFVNILTNLHHGRIGRKQFSLTIIVGAVLLQTLLTSVPKTVLETNYFLYVYYLVLAAATYYFTCLSIRRLHDIGRSGYWAIISLIPLLALILFVILDLQSISNFFRFILLIVLLLIVNFIFTIYLMCKSGQKIDNQYGSTLS